MDFRTREAIITFVGARHRVPTALRDSERFVDTAHFVIAFDPAAVATVSAGLFHPTLARKNGAHICERIAGTQGADAIPCDKERRLIRAPATMQGKEAAEPNQEASIRICRDRTNLRPIPPLRLSSGTLQSLVLFDDFDANLSV